MMASENIRINTKDFNTSIFNLWDHDWLLLTSGDFQTGKFNAMTIAWGGLGIMWNMPIAMVVVRPSRYTYEFINAYDSFTVCGFPHTYRHALSLLGTRSGRDGNKIKKSGLTPITHAFAAAPGYKEANLVIACRKIYFADFDPSHFMDERIENQYGGSDYHRMLYGEILSIEGDPSRFQSLDK
jgi:flavin reductase (DIM6/NTAB) family NADH-FMN oxidoreductase RutF